jgi:hypothetical protein
MDPDARELPLLDRRGGCGNKKNREASARPQTGWWFNKFSSNLDHHLDASPYRARASRPPRTAMVASRHLLWVLGTPPGQAMHCPQVGALDTGGDKRCGA